MNIFFDTSALIKFFHEEPGTEKVTDLINNPGNNIFVSDLARLEFISALYRRYRNNEIDEQSLNEAISGFDEEYSSFHVEPLGNMVLQEAENLIKNYGKTYGLRTLDAIHLATFILIKENDDWLFVASDDHLIDTAKALGALVFNPLHTT
ncbi:MAG: type II toxin-antitoxin system VapC family toxin [Bacillota bacterium]|nr:type II toxin-antitoxin system VapC family toxin [Bacillota bacterium]